MENIFINLKNENDFYKKLFKKDLVSVDELLAKIEDLDCDIKMLEEKIEDIERNVEDNFERKPLSNYTGDVNDDKYSEYL